MFLSINNGIHAHSSCVQQITKLPDLLMCYVMSCIKCEFTCSFEIWNEHDCWKTYININGSTGPVICKRLIGFTKCTWSRHREKRSKVVDYRKFGLHC